MKIVDEPVVVEYVGQGGSAFTLPPAGFVSISQSGGWVYDITVALPKRSGPLAEVYSTAAALDTVLSHTGWQRTGGTLPGLEQIRRDLTDPVPGFGGDHGLGGWRFGSAELLMSLKRMAERGARTGLPGRRVAGNLYSVEIEIYDGARLDSYEKRTYSIRRARHQGNADQPLPLDAVLDDPTPVPNSTSTRTSRP